jgi:hypothetical protein
MKVGGFVMLGWAAQVYQGAHDFDEDGDNRDCEHVHFLSAGSSGDQNGTKVPLPTGYALA